MAYRILQMAERNIVEIYDRLIASFEELTRKGKSMPYTSMNGNMFTFVTKEGDRMAFRLSKQRRTEFLEHYPDSVVVQYDTIMKDYVAVPESFYADEQQIVTLLTESVEHAKTLKPKPTTKKKKS